MTETATPAAPKITVVQSFDLQEFIKKFITYNCSLNALLEIFCSNWLPEIRQACMDRLDILFKRDEFYYDDQTLDKLEEVIRQLFDLSIINKFAERLLEMYVFCRNQERSQKAMKFAISLLYRNSTSFLLIRTVSKVVCSRLNEYCPNECYNENGEFKTSIYKVLPELKRMLQLLFERPITSRYLEPTKERPWKCDDFCLVERALKVIVFYREHDQSFLPQIEEFIRLYKEGLLIFDSRLTFESTKNMAVLKEAAKLLRQAQKQAQKK